MIKATLGIKKNYIESKNNVIWWKATGAKKPTISAEIFRKGL